MRSFRVLAWVWVAVLVATGAGGGVLMDRVGWALAMGLTIYTGNTEPVRPELPFPWAILGLCALVACVGVAWVLVERRRRVPGTPAPSLLRSLLPVALAYAGGLCAAVLPFVHLLRLFAVVQAGAPGPTP